MKSSSFFTLLFFTAFVMLSSDCKKNKFNPNSDNGLPPATQTGQGIFACRVNGQPWISKKGRPDMGVYFSNDTLNIGGTVSENGFLESFTISLVGIYTPTKQLYELNDTSKAFVLYLRYGGEACFSRGTYGGVDKKITNGSVTITKVDTAQKIFSGTFHFNIPTDFCDTLKITDGRFDIKYQ